MIGLLIYQVDMRDALKLVVRIRRIHIDGVEDE